MRHPSETHARPAVAVAAATTALLLLTGCAAAGPSTAEPADAAEGTGAGYPVQVSDCGRSVTVEQRPEQVLTIGQAALWLVEAAGAGDLVVARSGEFDAPVPEALATVAKAAEVVDPADPSLEKIVGAEVDTVVGYGLFSTTPEDLAQVGVMNLTVSGECGHGEGEAPPPVTFDTVFDDIVRFGEVFGTAEEAGASVEEMRARVEELRDRGGAKRSAASVYYFSSGDAMSAYGGAGIGHEQLTSAGLENVYGDEPENYLETSIETLLEADPEVVVLSHGLYGESFEEARARFESEPGAQDLQAVREGHLIGVPADQVAPSPGAVDGLATIVDGLATLP